MHIRSSSSLMVIFMMALVLTTRAETQQPAITPTPAATSSDAHLQTSAASQSSSIKKDAVSHNKEKPVTDTKPLKNLPSDVRILIDVSGSMKKTDPKNLRKPAIDLILRLLPDKSRAGIWTFGQSVNMLMPLREVNASWRKEAESKANEINSTAFFTNIGQALDAVSFDHKNLSTEYKTHIILFTDGVVDISKEAVVNMKERQRILTEVLPNLKHANYIIHSIALSDNTDADLLKKISAATDGLFTIAHSADELTAAFLKIFDQAAPAERVPLENNGFLVDASVKEFTALIFRKPGVERSIILSPEGKEYSATNPQDGINWYRTDKYDLITADTPKAGQWKIKTEITPQSRITVVSNLQLIMQPLKNNIYINDGLALAYSFQEDGKTITSKDFLNLLEANAIVAKNNTEKNTTLEFATTEPPVDGIYHQNISVFSEAGDYEVHVYVDGKTFKREFKHSLSVRESLLVIEKNNTTADDGKVTYSYKISTDEKIVDPNKIHVSLSVKDSLGNNVKSSLHLSDKKTWDFVYSPSQAAEYQVTVHAEGEMLDGTKLDETIVAEKFSYKEKEVIEVPIEPENNVDEKKVDEEKVQPAPEEAKNSSENTSNLWLYVGIAIGNLLMAVLGYFGYRMIAGKKSTGELSDIEKTLAADIKPSGKTGEKKTVEKAQIDLSDDNPAHIPMNDMSAIDTLFPLDTLEETKKNDKKL